MVWLAKMKAVIVFVICLHLIVIRGNNVWVGAPYTRAPRIVSECETVSLAIGTALADNYNSFDEDTEWDVRIHSDCMVRTLGFASWVAGGLWKSGGKTPHGAHAPTLHAVQLLIVNCIYEFLLLKSRLCPYMLRS